MVPSSQPSPSAALPSSQISAPARTPLPHALTVQLPVAPSSQPSPSTALPSSQLSASVMMPLPHAVRVQLLSQLSPLIALPSSHASLAVITPLPQPVGRQLPPTPSSQPSPLRELPSSQPSSPRITPSPQRGDWHTAPLHTPLVQSLAITQASPSMHVCAGAQLPPQSIPVSSLLRAPSVHEKIMHVPVASHAPPLHAVPNVAAGCVGWLLTHRSWVHGLSSLSGTQRPASIDSSAPAHAAKVSITLTPAKQNMRAIMAGLCRKQRWKTSGIMYADVT